VSDPSLQRELEVFGPARHQRSSPPACEPVAEFDDGGVGGEDGLARGAGEEGGEVGRFDGGGGVEESGKPAFVSGCEQDPN
jgi:hypothetical protein